MNWGKKAMEAREKVFSGMCFYASLCALCVSLRKGREHNSREKHSVQCTFCLFTFFASSCFRSHLCPHSMNGDKTLENGRGSS